MNGLALLRARKARFTVAFLLSLTFGIAGVVGVLSILRYAFFSQGWLREDRIVSPMLENVDLGYRLAPSAAAYREWSSSLRSFDLVAGFALSESALRTDQGARSATVLYFEPSLFSLLEAKPTAGRFLVAGEPQDIESGVLLSERLARQLFGGATRALGGTITLDGRPLTVVGTLPQKIEGRLSPGEPIAAARLLDLDHQETVEVLGRLHPGVSRAAAQSELAAWAGGSPWGGLDEEGSRWVLLRSTDLFETDVLRMFQIALFGALILVVATGANLAHFLAAQAESERREVSTRWALGATRLRLLGAWLRSYAPLPLLAGVLASFLAVTALGALAQLAPESLRVLGGIEVEPSIVALAILISYLLLLLFGALPAAFRREGRLSRDLATDGRFGRPLRLGQAMAQLHVVTMVAVAFVLTVASGLVISSVVKLNRTNWGFEPDGVQTFRVQLPGLRYSNPTACAGFFTAFTERLTQEPTLQGAVLAETLPPETGFFLGRAELTGGPEAKPLPSPMGFAAVGARYFSTLRQPLLAGREFSPGDLAARAPVAVIAEAVARRAGLSPQQALGHQLRLGEEAREVIGVVRDVETPGTLKALAGLQVFVPLVRYARIEKVVVRSDRDLSGVVRQVIAQLEPDAVVEPGEMTALIAHASSRPRFLQGLFAVMTAIALTLALFGVYGVLMLSVAQQRGQIALRLALGAERAAVRNWLVGRALRQAGIGLLIGLTISYPFCHLLEDQLFGVGSDSPATRLASGLAILVLCLLATVPAARRAAEIEAQEILKQA